MSRGGRGAGLVLLGVVALLVAWYGGHRTRSASTGATTAGREQRRAHVDRGGPALSSIAGTIRDDANTPLLHVRVCARLTDGPTACATADELGAYAIDNLGAGKYQIAAIADRHLPMRSDGVVLRLGEHREGVDLVLAAGGVEITGTVSDLGGGAIARAEVHAVPTTSYESFASVETDDGGRFDMWVSPGSIEVYADADGYVTAHGWNTAPGTFDLVMTPAGTLGGVVLDAQTRMPVVGARVRLSRSLDDYPRGLGDEVTDAEGRFLFEGLSPDRYVAIAVASDAYGRSDGSVRVGLGQHVDDAVVLLQPAAGVEGKVLVGAPPKPCPEPSLSFLSEDYDRVASYLALYSRAGADGSVRIDGLRPGTYRFEVSCEGYTTVESPPVEVADGDVTGLVWTLSPSPIAEGTIRGRVLSSAGEPIRGAQVSASEHGYGHGNRQDISHSDGSFVLDHLEAGRFTVEVRSERGVGPERGWTFWVDEGETVTSDLVLAVGGVISGTVTDPDGSPAANVVVRNLDGNAQRTSDASGRFRFEGLREGSFDLAADADDADGDYGSRRKQVIVRPGETSTVKLVMAPRTQRITGVVVGADGKPRTGVYVAASHDIPDPMNHHVNYVGDNHVLTSADGAFGLGPLAEGTYIVHAYEPGGAEAIVENVRPGTAVRLQLRQTGSIAGTVHAQVDDFEVEIGDTRVPTYRKETFYRTAGCYHVEELPPGSYRVTVRAGGQEAETTIELAPGAHLDHVDIAFDQRTERGRLRPAPRRTRSEPHRLASSYVMPLL